MLGWFRRPASETQVTHGQRLWLYVFAGITMLLLVTPTLIVVPMFILLGELMLRAGIARRMYEAMIQWLSWLPGGSWSWRCAASQP